jgi:hypothetical protein
MFLRNLLKSKSVQALALTAAVGMVGATAAPRRAEAVVGLATVNVPAIIVGAGFLAAAGSLLGGAYVAENNLLRRESHRYVDPLPLLAFSVISGIAGLIILDAEDPTSLRFQALSAQNRITIGISEAEYRVYASEIEEINAAWDEAARQALRAEVQTAEQAQAYFDREFASLSPETRTVMSQVVRHAVAQN